MMPLSRCALPYMLYAAFARCQARLCHGSDAAASAADAGCRHSHAAPRYCRSLLCYGFIAIVFDLFSYTKHACYAITRQSFEDDDLPLRFSALIAPPCCFFRAACRDEYSHFAHTSICRVAAARFRCYAKFFAVCALLLIIARYARAQRHAFEAHEYAICYHFIRYYSIFRCSAHDVAYHDAMPPARCCVAPAVPRPRRAITPCSIAKRQRYILLCRLRADERVTRPAAASAAARVAVCRSPAALLFARRARCERGARCRAPYFTRAHDAT